MTNRSFDTSGGLHPHRLIFSFIHHLQRRPHSSGVDFKMPFIMSINSQGAFLPVVSHKQFGNIRHITCYHNFFFLVIVLKIFPTSFFSFFQLAFVPSDVRCCWKHWRAVALVRS